MADLISIVVPCYNEQEALPIFYKTAMPIFEKLPTDIELIFVDDGSKDNTSNLFKELASNDKRIKYIILSRNFGKEAAMFAGIKAAKGNYVAVMDVDLQDPPEKVEEMYNLIINEDYDCVATRRVTRKGEPKIRSWFARKFYSVINKWSETEIVDGARDFRLMKRKMVDAILSMEEYNRFSKGLFSWVGFKVKWLEYENIERCAGETKWNFKSLFKYAIEGFLSFTVEPLYMIMKFGITISILDFIAAVVILIISLATSFVCEGWLILLLSIIFMFGIGLICLGIVALYNAKMVSEIKKRPIYIAKEDNLKEE